MSLWRKIIEALERERKRGLEGNGEGIMVGLGVMDKGLWLRKLFRERERQRERGSQILERDNRNCELGEKFLNFVKKVVEIC